MKGVPIKFRGKSEVTGKTIYGIGVKVFPDYSTMILDSLACEDVEKNSVAQLIGYDADGNEVYEDDTIFDAEHNDILNAELYPSVHLQYYQVVKEDNNESSAI